MESEITSASWLPTIGQRHRVTWSVQFRQAEPEFPDQAAFRVNAKFLMPKHADFL
jgi:hypothetical protein